MELTLSENAQKGLNSLSEELSKEYGDLNAIKKTLTGMFMSTFKATQDETKALRLLNVQFRKLTDKVKLLGGRPEGEFEGVFIADGPLEDSWAPVITEIDKIIQADGLQTAIDKGYVRGMVDNRPVYIDYRMFVMNNQNKYQGQEIESIPHEVRFRKRIYGISKKTIEGNDLFIPFILYWKGANVNVKIPLFKPVSFKARGFGQQGTHDMLITKNLTFNVIKEMESKFTPEIMASLFRQAKPFYVEFKNLEAYNKQLQENREKGLRGPSFVISEADVWRIEDTSTNNYRVWLADLLDETTEPIQAFVDRSLVTFGEFSKIFFVGNIFNIDREVGDEKVKQTSLKIISVYPKEIVAPEVEEIKSIPSPGQEKQEVKEKKEEDWFGDNK